LIGLIIGLAWMIGWLFTARKLFTYIKLNGLFDTREVFCDHGNAYTHRGLPCHRKNPCPPLWITAGALGMALVFPIIWAAALVMWHQPKSTTELEQEAEASKARTAQLLEENEALRKIQEALTSRPSQPSKRKYW
jgi:hypothetical protein